MITQSRAHEIIRQAKNASRCGPWSDQLDKVMTPEEKEEVKRHWETMDGSTNFVQALYEFAQGKVNV